MERTAAQSLFIESTQQMFAEHNPLMQRVIGDLAGEAESWVHYPVSDVVNGTLSARWFYHCHAPEERGPGEHGHFHLFVGKMALPETAEPMMAPPPSDAKRAEVVHVGALSIDYQGLPTGWFTTNRWVTDEFLYPAEQLIALLPKLDFRGPQGDPLVNDWLTAIAALQTEDLSKILRQRDLHIADAAVQPEDRGAEVLSSTPLDLETMLS